MDAAPVDEHDPMAALRRALARPAPPSTDFDLNPEVKLPPGRKLRPAAVLVAVQPARRDGRLEVILTKRSSRLAHHPGQVAFPGGKPEPCDDGLAETALREAQEEVGLDPASVEILGALPVHETVTGFTVAPFLARVHGRLDPVPEAGEVDEVFTVPLAHLVDPARYHVERRRWLGQWRRYYTVTWGPYYIWGATARILRALAEQMRS